MAPKPKKPPKKVFGKAASKATSQMVKKAKKGEGTLSFTPKKKGGY